ncbi:MAG TPA: polyamine ABC transporter ATP-binding protein [Firmicutes bacterium]|jgi:putative spermidine/putrescine transport system ATP-binding protein|nr:polyamine ABC transporter ATP-binding protein [Bacillota bacterium]
MSGILIDGVSHSYGSTSVLEDVALEIKEGELFSLLGPSGCGKSTLLNVIAGFLEPTAGTIHIGEQDVTGIPPYRRKIGMVFQDYALFPHLDVYSNVAYGLTLQKLSRPEIKKRVMEYLTLVHLEDYADRMPAQLSGGQQQRVAIARALAIQPEVLLFDEPLSNLDAKLRKEMQIELINLQRRVGITTVFVTHDQEEALSLSDHLGILQQGRIQQIGTPLEIYRRPTNRFVAEFIGQVNLCNARIAGEQNEVPEGCIAFTSENWSTGPDQPLKLVVTASPNLQIQSSILLMLRPERIRVDTDDRKPRSFNQAITVIKNLSYVGNSLRIVVSMNGGGELLLQVPDPIFKIPPYIGQKLYVSWDSDDLIPVLE